MQRIVVALAAVAALTACSSPDSPPPASPLDERRLEHLVEACGSVNTGPRGDVSFRATAAPAEPVEEAMTARVKIDVDLDSAHGKHSAGLKWVHGYVTDEKDTVVGLVTGIGAAEGASGAGVVELTLAPAPSRVCRRIPSATAPTAWRCTARSARPTTTTGSRSTGSPSRWRSPSRAVN